MFRLEPTHWRKRRLGAVCLTAGGGHHTAEEPGGGRGGREGKENDW